MAGTQFLCFADLIIYKGVSSYNLNSAEPIEIFYDIRLDINKLKYAVEVTKIASDVTEENEGSYRILQLVLNTLYMISKSEKDLDFILSVYKLRLLSIIGFRPIIEKCARCNKKEDIKYFSFKENGFKCRECAMLDKGTIELSTATIQAIKFIIKAEPKKIFSFDMADENKKQLKLLTKIYLDKCIEREYD